MSELWGIDLGGTKIEGVVLRSKNDINPLARLRIPTEAHKGYEHIIVQVASLIDQLSKATGSNPSKIGIGTPGAIDSQTSKIKNSNSTVLNGRPFKIDLENKLGLEISMANDANCFALAETLMGAVKEYGPVNTVFGVIMGTGVGGGIVVDGKVISGLHGIGGEWGHNFLDEEGGNCYCGRSGCVETLISGPALERYYQKKCGTIKSLKEINNTITSDPVAKNTINHLHNLFGKAIAVIINILDPDVIVLGGGVGNIDTLYTIGKQEAEKYVFNTGMKTKFIKPKLGDSAGVFGAALLTI